VEEEQEMSYQGKAQITMLFTAPPDLVEEGDRIWQSHAAWIERTHNRDGDKALLMYNIVKGPELTNPLDPSSEPTGNTTYGLTEVYETPAGVDNHWKQTGESWEDVGAIREWASKCTVVTLHGSPVIQSLW
jgi:hypothetical protein